MFSGERLMPPCMVLMVVLFVACFAFGAIEANLWR